MKKVLITGATGFIGQRLVAAIDKNLFKIIVVSRQHQIGYETIICDFKFQSLGDDVLKGVDTVFHLAGAAHDSYKDQQDFIRINFETSLSLAKLAAKNSVKKFVFLSSVKSTDASESKDYLSKTGDFLPDEIYGKTKRMAEIEILKIGLENKILVSVIRPALVYGPNVKGNLGSMINGIKNGWFPPLPKLDNCRSLVHVDDVVRAIIFVSDNKKTNGEIFNLTDGNSYTSREIYEVICDTFGKKIPNWSVPYFLFEGLAFFVPSFREKFEKLFKSEFYSSKKINSFGFKPKRCLKEINETFF